MPTNGTLKYKQDDGSIVELHPVGVDTEARTLATTEAARSKAAEQKLENDKADKSAIPDVSALVTKEIYDAGQAAQDAKIAALENVAPDKLPYMFDRITISSFMYSSIDTIYAVAYLDLPWLHSQNHQLTARLGGSPQFYVVNLINGSVQTVTEGISIHADCSDSSPYHVNIQMQIPASITANTPYLVTAITTFISIE